MTIPGNLTFSQLLENELKNDHIRSLQGQVFAAVNQQTAMTSAGSAHLKFETLANKAVTIEGDTTLHTGTLTSAVTHL